MEKNKRYTYTDFAQDAIAIAEAVKEGTNLPEFNINAFMDKALKLDEAQAKKAEYNKNRPAKEPKGPSDETKARAAQIKGVLKATPMTAMDINAALGTAHSALAIANAAKYIEGIKVDKKVIRTATTQKGLKQEREYTGYFL